jgi:LysR family transcriptional regulator, cys regulon transcriptional activator
VRHGKRLRRVTEPGQEVLKAIDVILREVANMKRIGEEYSKQDAGTLSIAATHTQARYVLPEPVAQLRRRFPKVQVSLHQGSPSEVVQMLLDGTADIGLATESLSEPEDLVSLPCYEWEHVIVMRADDPLAQTEKITLEQLAGETLISYHPSFTGRKRIDAAFAQRRLKPNIALEAIDSDVIKTYVRSGLGVGIVAEMAVRDDPPGGELVSRPAGHLFGSNVTRVAFRRGAYLRGYVLTFAELLSDRLTRPLLLRALGGTGENYDL